LIVSKVEYVAMDDKRQEIAWVRVSRGDGNVTEYDNQDNPPSEEERELIAPTATREEPKSTREITKEWMESPPSALYPRSCQSAA
jgi:hypothetical protein